MHRGAYLLSVGLVPYGEAFDLQRSLAGAVSQGAIPETVVFLEHPFQRDGAYVSPGEMQTSIRLLEERSTDALAIDYPCDEEGRPLGLE